MYPASYLGIVTVPSYSLPPEEYQALASFRYAMRKFLRFSKDFLEKQAHLTPEQYEALLALRTSSGKQGLLVGELSERLQVRHHTTVALTNKLVERGFVTKRRGRGDRRQVNVKLTARGETLLERLAAPHRQALCGHSPEIMAALEVLQKRGPSRS